MFFLALSVLFGFMFYFVNTLYFVFVLLFSIIFILIFLFFSNAVSSIFCIMIAFVYIGAMIIFIGYVCAVSPNPLFVSSFPPYFVFFLALSVLFFGMLAPHFSSFAVNFLSDFFYARAGCLIFFLITLMLFLLLIIVSSQFYVPKGPFRSV